MGSLGSDCKLKKGNLCRPRPTVLHVPLWKESANPVSEKMTQVPVRPHTRRRYLIPTRSLKTLVRFTMTYISSSDCPGCLPGRSTPSGHSDNLDFSDRYATRAWAYRIRPSKWAGRVLATLFARNFGARPGCPASDHPLTLGVRPSLGPLRWSKQAETWPDPRTSWVASGFYLRWALTN